jgi:hypothetical protein
VALNLSIGQEASSRADDSFSTAALIKSSSSFNSRAWKSLPVGLPDEVALPFSFFTIYPVKYFPAKRHINMKAVEQNKK